MRIVQVVIMLIFFSIRINSQDIVYPEIQKSDVSVVYHDTTLMDEFVNLEKINAPEVEEWLSAQRKLSRKHLRKVRNKKRGFSQLDRLGYATFNLPIKKGKYYYSRAYYQANIPPAIYRKRKIKGKRYIFIDPLELSSKDNISLGAFAVSKDDKYVAFSYGRNGSDWREIRVKKDNGRLLKDKIIDAKFTAPVWRGEGFYYLKYNRRDQFSPELTPQLYYHRLNTPQEEDELIFRKSGKKFYEVDFKITKDERFLLVFEEDESTGELTIYAKDYASPNPGLKPLFSKAKDRLTILGNDGDTFYAYTGKESKSGTVIKFDLNDPYKWEFVLPEITDAVLVDVKMLNGMFCCEYLQKTTPLVVFFDKTGEIVKTIPFGEGFSIGGFYGDIADDEIIYYMTSYYVPPVVYKLNLNTFESELVEKTKVTFDAKDFQITTIDYPSKDGTMIPMTIFSKKDLELTGDNPLLLKTYGGYGSIHAPSFDEGLVFFLQKGGVFAYAHVRGEGNFGRDWALAGRNMNRQNSIDDFIAAAEYLIKEKYTKPSKLAITGGSHGGLMVGAAMTQRPELFRVAVPEVGVFDMINMERFTVGQFHKDEYGTVANKDEFYNMLSFSPYHQIRKGVNYPTTLIMTGDNDDRVPPFHSYKFAAKLQNNPGQTNPVYLRVEKDAGHSGSTNVEGALYEKADMFSFIMYHLMMK